jgi:prepilin-type N-terminal cleavage/methylation domain-containing protein
MNANRTEGDRGFTLPEVMIACGLIGLVMAGAWSVLIMTSKIWNKGAAELRAAVKADRAVNYILYGGPANDWTGVRDVTATSATLTTSSGGWVFNAGTNQLAYSTITQKITDRNGTPICDDMLQSTAVLMNSGLQLTIKIVENSATFAITNTTTSYVRMRN